MKRTAWLLTALLLLLGVPESRADLPTSTTLAAPDGSEVVIHRDAWGVPHIYGTTETGVFYGQGVAAAQDRWWQMEVFRRAALGRLSELQDSESNNNTDALVKAVFYTEAERAEQFAALPMPVQQLYEAYVAGINAHVGQVFQQLPDLALVPAQIAQLLQAGVPPVALQWSVDDAVAVTQFFMRRFGGYGGEEVTRFLQCQVLGADFIRTFYPLNDPTAPTTIPDGVLPRPDGYAVTDALADGAGCPSFALPPGVGALGHAAPKTHAAPEATMQRLAGLSDYIAGGPINIAGVHVPEKLGSFGVVAGPMRTADGSAMLLGAPQLGPPLPPQEPFISSAVAGLTVPHEVELWEQGGDLHVGGMTIAGIPGVIIGRTGHHAWSLTSGNTDNTDIFIEIKTSVPGTYLYNGVPTPFETPGDKVRSVHGPVVQQIAAGEVPGVPVDVAISLQFTFWEREMTMVSALYDAWKAESRGEFEEAITQVPMSFNVVYADKDGKVGYWHVGLYQNRQDGVDPRFPHLGIGTQEWDGILPFEDLPKLMDPPGGLLANWNNKPVSWWSNGDRGWWATTDTDAFDRSMLPPLPPTLIAQLGFNDPDIRAERTVRVQAINDYLATQPSLTFEALKAVQLNIEDAFGSYSSENPALPAPSLDLLIEGDRGTYQQAIAFLARPDRGVKVRDENLVPPGQSGFISVTGELAPHFGDQWPLNVAGDLKDMLFGAAFPDVTPPVCGMVTEDDSNLRIRLTDTERGIASMRFVGPGASVSYELLDGTTAGPFGHQETVTVQEVPAALDVVVDPSGLVGRRPLVVQVINGEGLRRSCVVKPDGRTMRSEAKGQGRATLDVNRPNPFNPSTVIRFALPEERLVRLEVFDLLGRRVTTLIEGMLEAGAHEATWNGRSADGTPVAGGTYVYRLTAGDEVRARTMVLMK